MNTVFAFALILSMLKTFGLIARLLSDRRCHQRAKRQLARLMEHYLRDQIASGHPAVQASDRYPLDDVATDPLLAPVVKARRSGVGVPRETLHILERHALLQEVSDGRHSKRVR